MAAKVVIDVAARFTDQVTGQAGRAESAIRKLEKRAKALGHTRVAITLQTVDRATRVLNNIWTTGRRITSKVWRATVTVLDKATAPIRGILNLLKNPLLQLGIVIGVSGGISDVVKTYASFEAKLSEVKAISGASAIEMEKLNAKAAEMGRTTKFTATEAGDALKYMAMAGWKAEDMLNGIEGIMYLAAASGEELGTVSDIVTDAMTAFGLKAEEASHFADVLAVASSNSNTNVSMLGESFKYIAPLAGSLGFTIEDTATALGLMANSGIKASMSGTALRGALTSMLNPSKKAAAAMEKYGISMKNPDGSSKTLMQIMENLRASFGDLDAAILNADGDINDSDSILGLAKAAGKSAEQMEKLEAVSTLFGDRALPGMLSIIQASEKDFKKLSSAIANSEGAAKSMSEIMLDNLQGSLVLLQSAADGVKSSIGERLAPYLRQFVEWLTAKMPDIQNAINQMLDSIEAKIQWVKQTMQEIMGSAEWKDADLFGKAKLVWDNLIAEPFSAWWARHSESIKTTLVSGMAEIGSLIGQALIESLKAAFQAHPIAAMIGTAVLGSGALANMIGLGANAAVAGMGIMDFGANAAITLGAGNLAGGASLSSGALSAIGLGSVAGGVVGGAALFSGVSDMAIAAKSQNDKEREAYDKSASAKIRGVAAGAAIGAGIGSVVPVVGTAAGALIGAGIGGLTGMFIGEKIKSDYAEEMKCAEKETRAFELAGKAAKFSSSELRDALQDTSVSAEEFEKLFNKTVADDMRNHFGTLRMTAAEVKTIASNIADIGDASGLDTFRQASANAATSYAEIQNTISGMDKLNWKIGTGLKLDESELDEYKASLRDVYTNAKKYVENAHFESTSAIKLLVGEDSKFDFTYLDNTYKELGTHLDNWNNEYTAAINIALEDNIITGDEQKIIQDIQDKITAITDKVANAEATASLKALKIKYGGAALDQESFAALQTELAQQVQTSVESYDEALKVGLTALELQKTDPNFDEGKYKAQFDALVADYNKKISDLQLSAESFQLESIAEAYDKELENILPQIEGTTAEKLQTALNNALANGMDFSKVDIPIAAKMLGLDGLSAEVQTEIVGLLASVAATLPQSAAESITSALSNSNMGDAVMQGMNNSLANADTGAFSTSVSNMIGTALSLSPIALPQIQLPIAPQIASGIAAQDFSPCGTAVGTGVSNALNTMNMSPIESAVSTVKTNTGNAINRNFASGFDTTTTVRVRANYQLMNPSFSLNAGGASTQVTANITQSAEGRIVNRPLLSWVGEDGPEAIIPLGSKRRGRGLELWERAGKALGVQEFADGGMLGSGTPFRPPEPSENRPVSGGNISVQIGSIPLQIDVHGSEGDAAFADKQDEIIENVVAAFRRELEEEFRNIPVRGGVTT
jgi:TP901 family phage tail tape measure protein